jgi:replicative DNA helicase
MKPRVPPQDTEAERHLLGAILLNNDLYDQARTILTGEDFYKPQHRVIFEAIEAGGIDIVLCCSLLNASGKLEMVGGPGYIAALTDLIPTTAAAMAHARLIRESAKKRRFISRALEMAEKCYGDCDFSTMAAELEHEAFSLGSEIGDDEAQAVGPIVRKEIERMEMVGRTELSAGILTGFADFDVMTGGLQPADLMILAARPSMGKSALAMNIARGVCETGIPAGVFSLEMSKAGLGSRVLADVSKTNSKAFMNGWVGDNGRERVYSAAKHLDALPLYIDDTPALHISEMRSRARRMHRKHGIGLIVLDYIQMARGDGGNREQEVADISRGLKAMAKELNVPVLALAQLSRTCESRTDKRPILSDLRESGAIEQDADIVAFIYRDEYYHTNESNPRKGIAELLIRKQRNGPTGTVELRWESSTATFRNLEKNYA